MRHASGDAPRIKGTFSTQLFGRQLRWDAPRILWCATHRVKSAAGNALNDKPYYDAPRIGTSHFQNIKGTEGSYFWSLSPFFHFAQTDRTRPECCLNHFSHFWEVFKLFFIVLLHRSRSSTHILRDLKFKRRRTRDFFRNESSTGFSLLLFFFSCKLMDSIVLVMDLVMFG